MKCPKCGCENRCAAKFCKECGSEMWSQCPDCGLQNQPESKFCDECGYDLRTSEKAPHIDINKPQSYTPKHLAEKILTSRSAIEGERKLVTVLFADVANYTAMAEQLDPEEIHQIMDGCFKILMDDIHKYEGTINQFTGDGVMALFGAPVAHEDHAQRACRAALAIRKAVKAYGEGIKKETGLGFAMRIGLNSGPVIVGAIGDDLRMDYTAVGDTTNLASRMESAANPGTILVSTSTHRLVRNFFEFESHGEITLKGKKDSQHTFELIKAGEVTSRIEASVAKGLTRFVGRKNSMASLMQAFDKAKSGSGQIVAIVGEAGVGKSRLMLEMRQRLPQDASTFLEGRCIHFGGSMAYLPILDILRAYFEIQEGDREFIIKKKIKDKVTALDEIFNCLLDPIQELLSIKVDDDAFSKLEPKIKREKYFEALRDLLISASHEKPFVLVVEDLHWIDKTSEEFINYLIGWLGKSPILLILLYRPEYTHQWGSKTYYTQIGLTQLSLASSSELIRAILEEGQVSPDLKQLILDRSGGNPLFMEEFTHTLIENGSIERKNDQYALIDKLSEIQVPDTIQGIISARMDRLEDRIKRTMQVASVIGRDFAFRILQSITGMREELKSYLLNLQGLEFIYEKRLFPELEYIFKHALIQEVAYNSLLVKRRSEIHEQIGNAIEQIYAERLDEFYEMLAYHYSKSDNHEKSYQYLKLSGNKATNSFANDEAFNFYLQGIEVLNKMPATVENNKRQIDISLSLRAPIEYLNWSNNSLQIIENAISIAETIGDKRNAALLNSFIGNYYMLNGNKLKAIECSEKSFAESEELKDLDLMVQIGFELIVSFGIYGDSIKVVDIANKLIPTIEKDNRETDFFGRSRNPYCRFLCNCAYNLALLGKVTEGEQMAKKSLRFARDIQHMTSEAEALFFLAFMYYEIADSTNIFKYGEATINVFTETGFEVILPLAYAILAGGYYYTGDLYSAREYLQKGLKLQKDMGIQNCSSLIYLGIGRNALKENDLAGAQGHFEKALESATKNNEKYYEALSWIFLGRCLGKKSSENFDRNERYFKKGLDILDKLKIRPHYAIGCLYLGDLYNDMDRKEDAQEYLAKAKTIFIDMEMDYYLKETQEVLNRL